MLESFKLNFGKIPWYGIPLDNLATTGSIPLCSSYIVYIQSYITMVSHILIINCWKALQNLEQLNPKRFVGCLRNLVTSGRLFNNQVCPVEHV